MTNFSPTNSSNHSNNHDQNIGPDLELPDPILELLSLKMSRCEISIQQRWKYSLRAWLVQFYAKTHRSWSKNLSKKASVQRRIDVSEYFRKLVKENNLELEVMNVKTKSVMNMKTEPVKIEKTKPVKVKKVRQGMSKGSR